MMQVHQITPFPPPHHHHPGSPPSLGETGGNQTESGLATDPHPTHPPTPDSIGGEPGWWGGGEGVISCT